VSTEQSEYLAKAAGNPAKLDLVKELIADGANLNYADSQGITPLMIAAK